ncbi:UxaA family hydrolase [Devosia faecipullorum]|uniref:UxaA family hydrolase n=1 Tax=Devosia faecipullorum TaxID=2755039 RepID=UPI00187B6029|nr:UxaA family hydrolase [Devosia faecipullorum]MBE7733318.1 UxaA family hydrolase [Devosia faecipullorum]
MSQFSNAPVAILIAPEDNVAVVLRDFMIGEAVLVGGRQMTCAQSVPSGHKIALAPIAAGESIVKCGVPVGVARHAITPGEHVHIHNVASRYITDH